eukprot:TRINITY_DN6294_c0_g2_i1.p1 TRINITY_DN6294_c0_g2~~TRINITY_DN6294_c0_g2_i1.p1  ORF type:complete len:311 (-),score=78.13 TRINITY_DN6294_c0_g2_i1:412-1311(-)
MTLMGLSVQKAEEGRAHCAKAEKYLEVSWVRLKFSEDWDSAADEYSKAATCFKIAKSWDECIAAHEKACTGYANSGSLYHAGKQLDLAMLIARDKGELSKIEKLASRGGLLYRQSGYPEAAKQLLTKAAKIVESSLPEDAVSLYKKACETVGTEDRPLEGAQFIESAAKLMVRVKKFDEAAELLHHALGLYSEAGAGTRAGRTVIKLVIVQLGRGDSVAASKAYKTYGGYCGSFEASMLSQLTQGFTELDHEQAKAALGSSILKDLDNDYVRLVRDLKPPPELGGGQDGEDDDGEIDLC